MVTKQEELDAFAKLCQADVGDGHKYRTLKMEMSTEGSDEYGAYIEGYAYEDVFFGWMYAKTPMEAVDLCIAKALEVNEND